MALSPRARVLLLATLIFLALAALLWYLSRRSHPTPATPITPPASSELPPAQNEGTGVATAPTTPPPLDAAPPLSSSPHSTPSSSSSDSANSQQANGTTESGGQLTIPVVGVRPEQLQDTFTQSRSEGRTHNSIDIMAACGTTVVAAADGQIIKLFQSDRGGITVYQLGTDNRTVYYYAHLERYADGLAENRFARRGELIGYVGDSGNAGAGNCHLHFSIWLVTDPKRYWDGENINPYPLLTKR